MRELKIPSPDGNGFYWQMEVGEFERVHPVEKLGEMIITGWIDQVTNHCMFAKENNLLPSDNGILNPHRVIERIARQEALKKWEEELARMQTQKIPENLLKLLGADSKKDQLRLLNGLSLTTNELMAFICRSWDYGYVYSTYISEHLPVGLDVRRMPIFAYKQDDGKIVKAGKTSLTDGQIKQAIEQRSVKVVKFLDRGSQWHCFYQTYRSLTGKERAHKNGQPHIHYISSAWNLPREQVLAELRSKDYKLPSYHIDYHTHRNPRPAVGATG